MTHTDRFFFVSDRASHSILTYSLERTWQFVRAIGSIGEGVGQFRWPTGMCVYKDKLLVCDYNNHRLQCVDISSNDANTWQFGQPFASRGDDKGHFQYPIDVCTAGDVLVVSEYGAQHLQTFSMTVDPANRALTLTHRSFIGSRGDAVGQFKYRLAVACHTGPNGVARIFIGDGTGRIQSLDDMKSEALRLFTEVKDASTLAVSDDGLLFQCDRENGTVNAFDIETGRKRGEWDQSVWNWPSSLGIAVMRDFVCVSDFDMHCVHVIPRHLFKLS
jgi:hypothetical protein